jgi:hypothetical protein
LDSESITVKKEQYQYWCYLYNGVFCYAQLQFLVHDPQLLVGGKHRR